MKNSIKKLICIFLSVLLLIASLPATTFAEQSGGYYYSLDSEGNAEITGFNSDISGDVVIPEKLDGHPVTSIEYEAFYGCTLLTSLTIPDGVTYIGWCAFYGCASLSSITIPDSVTTIGWEAFFGCTSLASITMPDNFISIGRDAFSATEYYNNYINWSDGVLYVGKNLIECKEDFAGAYEVKAGTKCIADYAFNGCSSLTGVSTPDSVTSIGNNTFTGCTSLTSITIGAGVTDIGLESFFDCTSLISIDVDENNDTYCSQDGVLFNKAKTIIIQYPAGKASSSYDIPDSVTKIGYEAFYSCNSLANITIPDSVTEIEDNAFFGCTSLTSITIGDSVTSIGGSAFENCTSLTSITIGDSVKEIGMDAFSATECYNNVDNWPDGVLYIGNYLIECKEDFFGAYEVKAGTKCITDYAFKDCISLTSITIPAGVTSIKFGVFSGCNSLTSISIPDSVTSIGGSSFEDCTSLTSITIPDSVTSIEVRAFSGCTELTSITIPDGVTTIEYGTFSGCTKLTSITIPDSISLIESEVFLNTGYYNNDANWSYGVLYVGKHLIDCKDEFSGAYQIKSGTKCIAGGAFSDCASLTSITIPNSVTSIGESAFADCTSITNITIPDCVTDIGWAAFKGCSILSDVYYGGTEEQWNNIDIDDSNEDLTSATIHFSGRQHEHTWGAWSVTLPATCTSNGVATRTCSKCKATETSDINALGHSFGEWEDVVAATVDAQGLEKRVCSVCGEEETRATDKLPPVVFLLGDVNGDGKIKANDARIILRTAAGLDTLTEEKIKLADMNGDGKIKANDARKVLRIAAGLD